MMKTKAQHEMVGFALIIIVVAVLMVIFLAFSLNKPDKYIESPLSENFIESLLHSTTNCSKYREGPPYLTIRELTKSCLREESCSPDFTACELLNLEINKTLNNSFRAGEEYPLKAYSFEIVSLTGPLITFEEGNKTQNFRGASQRLENNLTFYLELYY